MHLTAVRSIIIVLINVVIIIHRAGGCLGWRQ
jgi:hypothetical protein